MAQQDQRPPCDANLPHWRDGLNQFTLLLQQWGWRSSVGPCHLCRPGQNLGLVTVPCPSEWGSRWEIFLLGPLQDFQITKHLKKKKKINALIIIYIYYEKTHWYYSITSLQQYKFPLKLFSFILHLSILMTNFTNILIFIAHPTESFKSKQEGNPRKKETWKIFFSQWSVREKWFITFYWCTWFPALAATLANPLYY